MGGYRDSELYGLLNLPLPPVRQIERSLRQVQPEIVVALIENEPEAAYIIDYYLRLFDAEVGRRFINSDAVPSHVLAELFSCQVVRHYLAAFRGEQSEAAPSIVSSYWNRLERGRMTALFQQLLGESGSARFSAVLILQRMQLADLRYLSEDETSTVLKYFRGMGADFADAMAKNLDLYDYLYRVAKDRSDEEYLAFLDQYTTLVVDLRIAENLTAEAELMRDSSGRIPFSQLVDFIEGAPPDSVELVLKILTSRGWVAEGTAESLTEFRADPGGTGTSADRRRR